MTMKQKVYALMADGQKRTVTEVAAATGLSPRNVGPHLSLGPYLRELVDPYSRVRRYWLDHTPRVMQR